VGSIHSHEFASSWFVDKGLRSIEIVLVEVHGLESKVSETGKGSYRSKDRPFEAHPNPLTVPIAHLPSLSSA
jgi:hypothetical protein